MSQTHVVRRGECFSGIAKRYGFQSYRTLYEHPDNAELRKKRPNPNVLHPGDEVAIPDRELGEWSVATTKVHRFQVLTRTRVLRVRLLDREGEPLKNAPYEIEIGLEVRTDKITDGDGRLEEDIPLGAGNAVLRLEERVLHLAFGEVNPLRDTPDHGVSGAQVRLRNLGYPVGKVDGIPGVRTRVALGLFQKDHDLEASCELDDRTRDKLEAIHGA